MLSDLQSGIRQLKHSPGFSLLAILTLALGIGACTAVYSVLQGVLLRPLPYADPEQLVVLNESKPPANPDFPFSALNYLDLVAASESYQNLAASVGSTINLTGESEPLRLVATRATAGYFATLGLTPQLGRTFLPEEDVFGQHRVAIVSHRFWQEVLGGSDQVLQRTLQLNDEPYQVIGVMPPGETPRTDIWLPMAFRPADLGPEGRDTYFLRVFGRIRPGITLAHARDEAARIAARLAGQYPDTNAGWTMTVTPLREATIRDVRGIVYTLSGAVFCVFLVACANVANLQLARTTVRTREMSLRTALGASQAQLVRQLLTESVLLAMLGGAVGVLVAIWGLDALLALAPANLPGLAEIRLDGTILALTLGLSLLAGIAFGLPAAVFGARAELTTSLKQGSRSLSEHGFSGRLRSTLVVFEVAAALALLTTAGLLGRSLLKLARADSGFDADRVAVMRLNLSRNAYPDARKQLIFAEELESRLAKVPGIESVGLSQAIPLLSNNLYGISIDGRPPLAIADLPGATYYAVSPGYFRAMGIRLISGRFFAAADGAAAPRVAVINKTFARQHFPGEDPIGRRMTFRGGEPGWREIVGVVADVRQEGPAQLATSQFYEPFAQAPQPTLNFLLRTAGPLDPVLGALRPLVYSIDPNQPVGFVRPLADALGDTIARQRFAAQLLAVFSVIALVICSVGIYGVMAYSVARRTREIGIRIALGAQPRDVLEMVIRQTARLVGIGLVLGLAGAYLAARAIEDLLYETRAHDLLTFALIIPVIGLAAIAASLLPARRATEVDPMVALRSE